MELKVKKKSGYERGRFKSERKFAIKYDESLVPEEQRYNVFERAGMAIIGHEDMLTQCRVCNELMTHNNFSVQGIMDRFGRRKLRNICITCDNENRAIINRIKRDPNTPPPGPNCDCCGQPFGESKPTLDHDHKTGKFRGWLHKNCNLSLGNLGDDEAGLQRALDYIKRTTPND